MKAKWISMIAGIFLRSGMIALGVWTIYTPISLALAHENMAYGLLYSFHLGAMWYFGDFYKE